jgi:hypothetical protein
MGVGTLEEALVSRIACTLGTEDLALQSKRWTELRVRAGLDRTATADGLVIRFRREPGVEEELRELVSVERQCCAWAEWSVDAEDEQVVLRACSTGEGIVALHGMFV